MLEIKDLTVTIEGRENAIVRNFNLVIKKGEMHVLMGPNGAGKSSIAHAIIGNPKYKTSGKILFNGEDITKLKPNERAKKGLFLAFQNPEEIEGVSLSIFLRKAHSSVKGSTQSINDMIALQKKIEQKGNALGLGQEFVRRSTNVGFSGGEKKRSEMLQVAVLDPQLIILDEIDSGLDVDGVRLVAKQIKKMADKKRSFLLITHNPRILKYIKPKFVHRDATTSRCREALKPSRACSRRVNRFATYLKSRGISIHIMINGKIVRSGSYKLAQQIEKKGFDWAKE